MENYLRPVCGSPLWDSNSVYSENPDLTFCFQYSLLVWIPCFLLWCAAPFYAFKLSKRNDVIANLSWLLFFRSGAIIVLLLIELINLAMAIEQSTHSIYYLTPIILICSYILVMFIMHLERLHGWNHSTLPFIFWLLLFITSLVTLRTKILFHLDKKRQKDYGKDYLNQFKLTDLHLFNFYIYFVFVVLNMILSACMERKFQKLYRHSRKSPEKTSNLLSMLTFWWINRLINTGYKRNLTRDDLWDIDDREKSETVTRKLETYWNPKALDYINKVREIQEAKNMDRSFESKANKDYEEIRLNSTNEEREAAIKAILEPSFALCLSRIFVFKFIGIIAIKVVHDLLNFARPIILDKLISFVKDKDQKLTVGLFYILALCLSSLTQSLIIQHYYQAIFILGNRLKISVMNVIFKKSLRLSTSARKSTTVGEMTNLITTNASSFEFSIYQLIGIISTPLQIIISSYMLWRYLGVATLAGLASMILFLPLNGYLAKLSKRIRRKKYKLQDSRLKMLNEVFSGIRVIKFMGWEVSFQNIIKKIRAKEITNLIRSSLLSTVSGFTWSCAPLVVAVVSFGTFILMDEKNNLDPNTAFVSLTLFNMLRFPLNFIPYIITGLIQLNVSLERIRKFLLKDEINECEISHENTKDHSINVKNVDLGWSNDEVNLNNVSFDVKKGELIAIVGKVGSGKSSLLSGLLGEMHKLNEGKINVNGSTAYVPQQAWIQNATVKDNILFGMEFDEQFYEQTLDACSLQSDLQIMPAGDRTEIGEKGINLSGGQKQRISLARAVYAKADIYMLDDPLSAVDSHVGKHIFDHVIGPDGLLNHKTRLFVTNSLSFLPQMDRILMLDKGTIVEMGTYDQLRKNEQGLFNEFIKNYLKSKEANQSQLDMSKETDQSKSNLKSEAETDKNEPVNRAKKDPTNKGDKIIEKEKIETGTVKLSVILEYLKACRVSISLLFVVLYILSYVSDMSSNFWLSDWSNEVDKKSGNTSKYWRLLVYGLLGFSKSFIAMLANVSFVAMFIKGTKILHNKLLYSVLRGNLRFFDSTPTGRIINRFTKDVEATEDSIPSSIKSLVDCFLGMCSTVIIIGTTTPFFLIALIPITAFYIFVQRYFVPSNRQLKRMQAAGKSPIFSQFSETQAGVSTVRAYKAEHRFINQMQSNIDEHYVYYYCNTISNRWLAIRLEIIGNVITILAALFAIIQRNSVSAGLAGLSISISLTISGNLNWFVRTVSEFEANITAVERIKEYFDISHEAEWTVKNYKPDAEWPQDGHISILNYSVKYRDDLDWVLKNLNIHIRAGEKVGIVGRTGAGKSSLALALFRLLELNEGEIVIDDVKIGQIGLHDLRHKLTIIPQDAVIFSGTIRMNLDPFQIYTDEQLWAALELAHLKDFVSSLDKKLDFECSEGGSNLSAGQRQLICLARALLRKTKILVLDEATASIDHNTDELIQQTIRTEFNHCTVLTIAHRLNTIMDSSRIIVLDRGQIIEFDTPHSLLANPNSVFYSMAVDAQLVKSSR